MATNISKNEKGLSKLQLPFAYRLSITLSEIFFVIILAIISANIILLMIDDKAAVTAGLNPKYLSYDSQKDEVDNDYSYLKTVDPFYVVNTNLKTLQANNLPESTLDVKIYGLRTDGEGRGSAILKVQGALQKLAYPGAEIAENVRLTAIFPDRIEINRNGRLETVYIDKNKLTSSPNLKAQNANTNTAKSSDVDVKKDITAFVQSMDLSPFRSGNRIEGFVIGQEAQRTTLAAIGLEIGDILNSVNGNSLHSWERVKEIADEFNDAASLNILIERRGESLTLSLPRSSLGI